MVLVAVPPEEMYISPPLMVVLVAVPPEEIYIEPPEFTVVPVAVPPDMTYMEPETTFPLMVCAWESNISADPK